LFILDEPSQCCLVGDVGSVADLWVQSLPSAELEAVPGLLALLMAVKGRGGERDLAWWKRR